MLEITHWDFKMLHNNKQYTPKGRQKPVSLDGLGAAVFWYVIDSTGTTKLVMTSGTQH
jgi:hypothetical protein